MIASAMVQSTNGAMDIRQMRERLGWPQRRVAERAGISESTVKRTERTGRGHNYSRISSILEEALRAQTPRDAIDHIATELGGSPSDYVREFQATLDGLPTSEQQWVAVKTFAMTMSRIADAQLRGGTARDEQSEKSD